MVERVYTKHVTGNCASKLKEVNELTKGDVYDYAQDSARSCYSTACKYKGGDSIDINYPTDVRDLLFSQLRNAGYRLAKILNDIL